MAKKVLLAEDDPTMVTLLQTLLKMEGFEVFTMDEDADVIADIRQVKPDIIFMDVHLRRRSGIEIAESIRKEQGIEGVRIVMTSGLDMREACLQHGADAFILKPFMPDDLISILKGEPG
jgi:DNA-binding response OmpR family regulator